MAMTALGEKGVGKLKLQIKLLLSCFRATKPECTVARNKFWSSMSFQNLVRLSQIKKKIPA
jgi:hypothetical protein